MEYWPRSIRANGHLMLNGNKMAKSTGNFMTLEQLVQKFGADATRIAIADAGDGVNDANFEEDVADNNILRLHNLREWCQEQVAGESTLRIGNADNFYDKLFDNEMNCVVRECYAHYEATNYKLALKSALYDLTSARDFYREAATATGNNMHKDIVLRYIRTQALLLAVIAPHWSEQIWLEVLGEKSSIQVARFPEAGEPDAALSATFEYVRNISSNITSAEASQAKKKAKGRNTDFDPSRPKKLTIFVAENFPSWQEKYVDLLKSVWNNESKSIDEAKLMSNMKAIAGAEMKKAMAFVQLMKRRLVAGEDESAVFNRKLVFDERSALKEISPGLKRAASLAEVQIVVIDGQGSATTYPEGAKVETLPQPAEGSVPGIPTFLFENVSQ